MINNKHILLISIILLIFYPIRIFSLYAAFHIRPIIDMPPKKIKKEDIKFCIMSPGYNIEKEVVRAIKSVESQTYKNWHMYVINDMSEDETKYIARRYIKNNALDNKVTLINNKKKLYQVGALYTYIHRYCNDEDIAILLDADDYLYTKNVLAKLYYVYKDSNIWITSSRYVSLDKHQTKIRIYKPNLDKNHKIKKFEYGHLRAFRVWLFKKLDKNLLVNKNGKFYSSAGDVVMFKPMLELAAKGHYKHLNDIMYAYDDTRLLNDFRVNHDKQTNIRNEILKHPKMRPLNNPQDIVEIWK